MYITTGINLHNHLLHDQIYTIWSVPIHITNKSLHIIYAMLNISSESLGSTTVNGAHSLLDKTLIKSPNSDENRID